MEKKIKSKIEIKLTEGERDLLYFYLLGVYSLEDIETFEEYPAVVDKLEESITEVAKSTRRRRGVESKIEKLERVKPMSLMGMMGEVAPQWVAKELNKIIDHLNSQDQEEEITAEQLCEDNRKRMERLINKEMEERGFIRKIKDTPEQKEEWEERFAEFFLYVTNDKNWVDGRPEWKGNVYITLYNAMKDFIKNLLLEREREVLNSMREWVVEYHKDNWDIRDFDAEIAIGKIIDRELSKLNK